jgi:hypothetical protein
MVLETSSSRSIGKHKGIRNKIHLAMFTVWFRDERKCEREQNRNNGALMLKGTVRLDENALMVKWFDRT